MRLVKPAPLLIAAALAWAAGAQAQQLYKWVGPDGKVTYSDTPPPPGARSAEQKAVRGAAEGAGASSDLPYELAQAAHNAPVTLYTMANCPPCDEGRALLAARGVPYSEKTVNTNEDIALLRGMGASQLPYLTVGRQTQQGFEAALWNGLLSGAGYPESNRLPRSYRAPAPEAAAPAPKAANAKGEAGKEAAKETGKKAGAEAPPPPTGKNVPPGFRF